MTPGTQPQPLPQSLTKSNFSNPVPALLLQLGKVEKSVTTSMQRQKTKEFKYKAKIPSKKRTHKKNKAQNHKSTKLNIQSCPE